jgi:uncharacterized protein YcfJ
VTKRFSVALLLLFTGCAHYRPIVDMQGVDADRYNTDLYECQNYATQIDPGAHAAVGAAAGAVFGVLIGAIIGGRGSIGTGAALGGVQGVAAGGAEGATGQRAIIMRCMSGRGYRVLY